MDMLNKVEEVLRKTVFYDELKCEWDVHSTNDLVMCLGNLNGHIGMDLMGCMEDMV